MAFGALLVLRMLIIQEPAMVKVDFKKELKHLYGPSGKEISIVDVPPMQFLMVDGRGNPNTSADYADAVEALFAVAYAIKFRIKKCEGGMDYGVMTLEGLWWAGDPDQFIARNKDAWQFHLLPTSRSTAHQL